jgi:hypothetical protein
MSQSQRLRQHLNCKSQKNNSISHADVRAKITKMFFKPVGCQSSTGLSLFFVGTLSVCFASNRDDNIKNNKNSDLGELRSTKTHKNIQKTHI